MFKIQKKQGKIVSAWPLGRPSPVLDRLLEEGRILRRDGGYRVLSREAAPGGSGQGQLAREGDYIKLDQGGWPYPNEAAWFRENHRPLGGDRYEQLPRPLWAWEAREPLCPAVEFLLREKGLRLSPEDPERYFSAPLWGTEETAPRDAVLVFYSLTLGPDGAVTDADFNFVVREEFDAAYTILDP